MDKSLEKFNKLNDSSTVKEETEHINIEKAWNDDTFFLRFKKDESFQLFENLILPKEFSALFHKDKNLYEFIFTPLKQDDEILSRKFEFVFNGKTFKAYYDKPSDVFIQIAKAFRETESSSVTDYRNLLKFRDFYRQDTLPEFVKRYFKDRIPVNFYIEGAFNEIKTEHIDIFKHLNFYMAYFDRSTPQIVLFDSEDSTEKEKYNIPCLSKENNFPTIINIRDIDQVLLDLMHVAKNTQNIRLKYIFYYQVLEYCSYYYLNNDLKRKLNNIVRNPDILNSSDKYAQYIVEEFKNFFKPNDDSQKLEKLIIDFCDYPDIKNELLANYEYFINGIEFDGGFKIPGIINTKECIENPPKNIMTNIKSNIEKIRNVLVHIRESRENKVIHPTERNNRLLIPYLYLLRRIAEVVAFRYE